MMETFGRRSVRDVLKNPRKESEFYVLVTRYFPMEFRRAGLRLKETPIDEWDRDLAPSSELLWWWKEGPRTPERWEEYKRRFLGEVPDVLIRRKVGTYKERALGKKVIFVCEEEDWEHPYCHTWIILGSGRRSEVDEMVRKTEKGKVPPHEHEWVAVDQDWEPPILTTYYRCTTCGAERQAVEVAGADEPQEEEEPEPWEER
jgi:uncharacterized protein YeaO (DUF488 family)